MTACGWGKGRVSTQICMDILLTKIGMQKTNMKSY